MKQFAPQQKGKKKGMRPAATAQERQSSSRRVGKSVANNLHVQKTIGTQAVQGMIKPGTKQIIDNRPQPGIIRNLEEDNLIHRDKKTFSNPLSQQKATIPDKQTREIPPANSSYQLTAMSYELPSMSNVETRPQTQLGDNLTTQLKVNRKFEDKEFDEILNVFFRAVLNAGGKPKELLLEINRGKYADNTDLNFCIESEKTRSYTYMGKVTCEIKVNSDWKYLVDLKREDWNIIKKDSPIKIDITIVYGLGKPWLSEEENVEKAKHEKNFELYTLAHEFGLHAIRYMEFVEHVRNGLDEPGKEHAKLKRALEEGGYLHQETAHKELAEVNEKKEYYTSILDEILNLSILEKLEERGYDFNTIEIAYYYDRLTHIINVETYKYMDAMDELNRALGVMEEAEKVTSLMKVDVEEAYKRFTAFNRYIVNRLKKLLEDQKSKKIVFGKKKELEVWNPPPEVIIMPKEVNRAIEKQFLIGFIEDKTKFDNRYGTLKKMYKLK